MDLLGKNFTSRIGLGVLASGLAAFYSKYVKPLDSYLPEPLQKIFAYMTEHPAWIIVAAVAFLVFTWDMPSWISFTIIAMTIFTFVWLIPFLIAKGVIDVSAI